MGNFSQENSLLVKCLSIGLLVIILFMILGMTQSLVDEREERKNDAIQDIVKKWGGDQVVSGPMIEIPYVNLDGENVNLYAFPKNLEYTVDVTPEVLHRSIFDAVVYRSKFHIQGNYEPISQIFSSIGIDEENIFWDKSKLVLGVSGVAGIQEGVSVTWNNKNINLEAGEVPSFANAGVKGPLPITGKDSYAFSLDLSLNGSEGIHFRPMGSNFKLAMKSSWNQPSFNGDFLPDTRDIQKDGFSASWNMNKYSLENPNFIENYNPARAPEPEFQDFPLTRKFKQFFGDEEDETTLANGYQSPHANSFGVNFNIPVDQYQQTTRSIKYGILVIVLTFLVFFFSEILAKQKIHPINYFLVGLSLTIFYVLLLSISEFIPFDIAYVIAAAANILLISGYSSSIFKKKHLSIILGGLLILIYGFLFILLRLEELSLIIGSIALFLILATVMMLSRNINWYTVTSGTPKGE